MSQNSALLILSIEWVLASLQKANICEAKSEKQTCYVFFQTRNCKNSGKGCAFGIEFRWNEPNNAYFLTTYVRPDSK